MKAITIIFPHQLFQLHPAINLSRKIYLLEEMLFFRQYNFHKQKLILHRASMKAFEDYLVKKKYTVEYIETTNPLSDCRELIPALAKISITHIHCISTTDNWLEKRIIKQCRLHNIELIQYATPNFLNNINDIADYFAAKKTYFQTDFYIAQRKQRNILLTENNKPLGGQWSYDAANRLKFPKNEAVPVLQFPVQNIYVKEAKQYIEKNFAANNGSIESFNYPVDFDGAEKWLADFVTNRLSKFGMYEDAIVAGEHYLYHSVLSPLLNIGLLNPQQIIDKTLDAAITYDVPLNSAEGFIRQIIGWREFIRIVYEREGNRQRTKNYWGFTRKIPELFRKGKTGIEPVDIVIKKILQIGYCHHIERLMVLGNFMLLCEFDPDDVYKWFMEMFVDSYDWVMVPNVYGMTQFADGGLMATKPYISGSNYLMKMSNFKKGYWQKIWDGLFWRFMHVHRHFFLQNTRLNMLVTTFDKMDAKKQKAHLDIAEAFLNSLDERTN